MDFIQLNFIALIVSIVLAALIQDRILNHIRKKDKNKQIDIYDQIIAFISILYVVISAIFAIVTINYAATLGCFGLIYILLSIAAPIKVFVRKERLDGFFLFLLLFINIQFYLGFILGFLSAFVKF